jgi:hypothetical protein
VTQNNKYELLQNEYIEWLLMDKHQRAVSGLPSSDVEWSKVKGISDRTVRKWKTHESFIEKYENRQREHALRIPGATVLQTSGRVAGKGSIPGGHDSNKSEHEAIKAKLIERAMSGDRASAELYFKTYGKLYVDEELASRKSDFRDMDVDGLYQRVLGLLPTEVIEAEIAKRLEVVSE